MTDPRPDVRLATISDRPLPPDAVEAAVTGPAYGAVVVFTGQVRNHDGGQSVSSLEYSAHPDAAKFLHRPVRRRRDFARERRVDPRAVVEFDDGDRGRLPLAGAVRGAVHDLPRHDRTLAAGHHPLQRRGPARGAGADHRRQAQPAGDAAPDHQRLAGVRAGGIVEVFGPGRLFRIVKVHGRPPAVFAATRCPGKGSAARRVRTSVDLPIGYLFPGSRAYARAVGALPGAEGP